MARGPGLLLLSALGAASCGGAKGRIVHSVTIDSDVEIDAGDATKGLANHPPKGLIFVKKAEFEPLALEIDRQRVESWFRSRGYFAAEVERYRVDEDPEGVAIQFFVDAGPLAILEAVQIEGAPEGERVDSAALKNIARLKVGEPVEYDEFAGAGGRMEARLANEGYAHAKVESKLEVERTTGRAIAHYHVSPGPLAYFGKVRVEGGGKLPDSFVLNRVAWKEGARFDPKELDQTRARLFQSGLVSDVHFDRESDDPTEVVDIIVRLATGKRHEIRLGAGIGLEAAFYEVRGRVVYLHKSFFDPLLTLRLELRPSYAVFRSGDGVSGFNWEASVDLERQDLFIPRLLGTIGAQYERQNLEGYSMTGPTGRIGLARTFFDDRLIANLALQYEQRSFSQIEFVASEAELESVGLIDPLNFLFLAPVITWEGRDDPIAPRRGIWASLRLESGWLFSESSTYLKVTPELRGFVPIGRRVVLAARARLGVGISDSAIPISQRYFGGGAESHRGFGRRRLSPTLPSVDGDQLPVGGEASFEASFETRVDVVRVFGQMLGVVAFVDAGDVTLSFDDLDFGNLHYAIGPGLRLTTPIGVVRLDAGVRLNRTGPLDPDPGSRFAIHLSLGEAF